MRDLDYLKLLAKEYPTVRLACSEIINLRAIMGLPKGTEYFFSDLHGEYEAFLHLLKSSSGIIREKNPSDLWLYYLGRRADGIG